MSIRSAFAAMFVAGVLVGGAGTAAQAGPVIAGTWYEMGWGGIGPTEACPSCVPSSGTPTVYADDSPWTFVAAGAAVLYVTDAFDRIDRFEVFDFGASLGLTSMPSGDGNCGNDPVPCLADPAASSASFLLAAGAHSITINQNLNPGGGAGYFMWQLAAVPEPATLALFGLGLAGLGLARRRRRTS